MTPQQSELGGPSGELMREAAPSLGAQEDPNPS